MQTPTLQTFENGLKLVLVPDNAAEGVTFGLFVQSGSRHETEETSGISHFIEHMLFKGTEHHSQIELSRAIEGCGGMFNAWTGEEGTCFYARVPFEKMKTAVSVVSEMFREPAFAPAEFERERLVVLQELKMYDDEPDSVASENLSRLMFPKNALGRPVGGNAAALNAMTADTLREYHRRAYTPSATVAILLGRFDCREAADAVHRALGSMPGGKPLPFQKPRRLKKLPKREITVRRDIQQTQLAIGFRTFGAKDPRRWPLAVFDAIMGRGMTSRLFQRIRERLALSYDIHTSAQIFDDCGVWGISAGLDGTRLAKAKDAIRRELDIIRSTPPSAAELKRVKDFLAGNWRLSLERQQVQMIHYLAVVSTWNRIILPHEVVDGIRAVTREDVLSVARGILVDDLSAVSTVMPN